MVANLVLAAEEIGLRSLEGPLVTVRLARHGAAFVDLHPFGREHEVRHPAAGNDEARRDERRVDLIRFGTQRRDGQQRDTEQQEEKSRGVHLRRSYVSFAKSATHASPSEPANAPRAIVGVLKTVTG